MGNLYNKTNAPYLIAGTLATLALLASGTLAVAPYVAFLSSIAAFNVALPVALSLSILSTLILVLSCKMISRNKKLAAQGAELNEKTELAAEQENTIQSLEPQIKGLNKKVSDLETKLDEISRQANGAATKDEVEELKVKIASVATKEEINKLSNEVEKLIGSAATKDEMEELKAKIASAATESKTQEKIFMKFCAKGEKRGKKAFEDFIFIKEIKTKLVNIYESIKNNINIVSSAKSGDSEEEQEKIQRGFIFHGPGGTGKSSIVEAIGDQLISLTTFIKVSGADLLEKSNINELFNKANENAPCIVLIDEIDSFGKGRTDANRVPLNYFFTRFDEADKGVTVFATTNVSLQDLDASLVRGSRLSSKLKFTMIEGSILKNILKDGLNEKLKNKKYKHAILRILNETRLTTLSISAADVECFINYIVEKLNNKIVTSNVPLPLILALATLSILVLALSCKIISNNVELEAKVKGQLEHKEEMLSLEHQELRDENTRLNERVDSLMEELCQCKLESEKNKLCLKSEYEDELRLRLEYEDELNLELEHKSREASSLRTQLTMLRKKVEVEEVKQLKTLESEEQHESSESDIEELEKKLCQSEKEKKELEGKVSDERQKRTDLESKVDKLCTKEKEYLSKIKELEKESLSLQKEEKESDNTLTTVNDDRDNKVKELNSSLLKQSSQIEQLQKALLEKKKEEVLFLQRMIEYVTDEVEKLVRENEVIRDDDKKVILQVIQATKSVLVEEAAQYLPGETSVPSFMEDPGYTSGCSTPTNSCHTF